MNDKLTPDSRELFKALAEDAGNWSGTPLIGGNVELTKEERGNLTHLKRLGLVTTYTDDERLIWASFTPAGIELAEELGIDLSWLR